MKQLLKRTHGGITEVCVVVFMSKYYRVHYFSFELVIWWWVLLLILDCHLNSAGVNRTRAAFITGCCCDWSEEEVSEATENSHHFQQHGRPPGGSDAMVWMQEAASGEGASDVPEPEVPEDETPGIRGLQVQGLYFNWAFNNIVYCIFQTITMGYLCTPCPN